MLSRKLSNTACRTDSVASNADHLLVAFSVGDNPRSNASMTLANLASASAISSFLRADRHVIDADGDSRSSKENPHFKGVEELRGELDAEQLNDSDEVTERVLFIGRVVADHRGRLPPSSEISLDHTGEVEAAWSRASPLTLTVTVSCMSIRRAQRPVGPRQRQRSGI